VPNTEKKSHSRYRGFFTVYLITCVKNGKRYIGVTGAATRKRWLEHCADAMGRNSQTKLHRAIRKYGEEAFTVTEIASAKAWHDACVVERALIASHAAFGRYGYNSTAGGDGTPGAKHSDEANAKKSAALKGRKPSPECFRNGREAVIRSWTPERRALVSERLRQKMADPVRKAKMIAARDTPECRAKMSASAKARVRPKQTPEHIEKRIAPLRGRKRSDEAVANAVAAKAAMRAFRSGAVPQPMAGD
jgi:group I intron endonuclease